ncbi:MAG: ribosome small subunit-dependent GTPase A [Clostridiales bacterium]|nr:ribosome small subunit-dependent GTPase A [Clostridiales bacterium]
MNNNLKNYGACERFFAEAALYPDMDLARVISQHKDAYRIITERGERFAEVSGRFRHQAARLSDYPAVGDFAMIGRDDALSGNAVIHRVLTRKSVFERSAVGASGQTQVVAANIDVVFICMALNSDYNPSRLERYLSVAWNSGATPVVVLTKSDLCGGMQKALDETAGIALGVDVVITSGYDQASCKKLLPYLKAGVTASFIGSSGVGKSTLINNLAGEERLATAAIRADGKGRHTTTRRELLILPGGGIVIDTPGMRELGADSVDLARSFADIDELAARCRFRDCTHTGEPGCAVSESIESGELDRRRLENYKKLQREARYDGLCARKIEEEKIKNMAGSKAQYKKMMDHAKRKNHRR